MCKIITYRKIIESDFTSVQKLLESGMIPEHNMIIYLVRKEYAKAKEIEKQTGIKIKKSDLFFELGLKYNRSFSTIKKYIFLKNKYF